MIRKIEIKSPYLENLEEYNTYLLDTKPNTQGTYDLCRHDRRYGEITRIWASVKGKYRRYMPGRYIEVHNSIADREGIYGSNRRISVSRECFMKVTGHLQQSLVIKDLK